MFNWKDDKKEIAAGLLGGAALYGIMYLMCVIIAHTV